MSEVLSYSVYIVAALLATMGVVLAIGAGIGVSTKIGSKLLPWLIPIIGSSIIVKTLISARNVDLYVLNPAYAFSEDSSMVTWVLRLFMWPMLALCGGYVFARLISRERLPSGAGLLFTGFIVYFICGSLLNAAFGSLPSFDYKVAYAPLIVCALYLAPDVDWKEYLRPAKNICLAAIALGLLAAAVYPKMAVQTHYDASWIPGLRIRLWGLDSHANTFGPMIVMFILGEMALPYIRPFVHRLSLALAVLALLLTQSKTAWGAGIAGVAVLYGFTTTKDLFSAFAKPSQIRIKSLMPLVIMAMGLVGGIVAVFMTDAESKLNRFLMTKDASKLTSFTGRDRIWSITGDVWKENPLFGYGPKLWGPEFSAKYGLLGTASNAHNQVMDIVGSAGLVGVVAFVVYWLLLLRACWAVRNVIGWLPMAMLAALTTRAVAEVPFRLLNVQSNDFAFHLLLLVLLFCGLRAKRAAVPGQNKTYPRHMAAVHRSA